MSSSFDPLDVTQYTAPELRAAVEAAENWGTYVIVHAYTPRAVRQAIEAGVKCIEHGNLRDEATAKPMAEKTENDKVLLVDGDPVANIRLIEDPAKNFLVIMKDGRLHKNLLP